MPSINHTFRSVFLFWKFLLHLSIINLSRPKVQLLAYYRLTLLQGLNSIPAVDSLITSSSHSALFFTLSFSLPYHFILKLVAEFTLLLSIRGFRSSVTTSIILTIHIVPSTSLLSLSKASFHISGLHLTSNYVNYSPIFIVYCHQSWLSPPHSRGSRYSSRSTAL